MMFISYKDIDRVYGSVDGFLNWLMNCSSCCGFRCNNVGIWYRCNGYREWFDA